MAKKVRFPLQMDGADARTIEELREHFDLESVLGYFANGKLVTWLRDRYYDNEAMAIEALSADDAELNQKIMSALGVVVDADTEEIDMVTIQRRNEKLMKLCQFTDDQTIIANVDYVAFNQDDLLDILDEGADTIYLCEGEFDIPLSVKNVTYIGLRNPIVLLRAYDNVNFASLNIKLVDICFGWDISSITNNDRLYQAERMMERQEFDTAIPILEQLIQEKNPRAFNLLALIYEKVYLSEENTQKCVDLHNQVAEMGAAFDWIEVGKEFVRMKELLHKLVNKGDKIAMGYLAFLYAFDGAWDEVIKYSEMGAAKNDLLSCDCLFFLYKNDFAFGKVPEHLVDVSKAIIYGEKAAFLGYAELANKMGVIYLNGNIVPQDDAKAFEFFKIAAEHGEHNAQYSLGCFYETERGGVKQDDKEAFYWFEKAVVSGDADALMELGACYENAWGTEQDYAKAFELYEKSANAGHMVAQNKLGWFYQNGYGVSQDYNMALYWYEKAGESGLEQGKENAQYIRNEMQRAAQPTVSDSIPSAEETLRRMHEENKRMRQEMQAAFDDMKKQTKGGIF